MFLLDNPNIFNENQMIVWDKFYDFLRLMN